MCRVTGSLEAGAAGGMSKAGDVQVLETAVDKKSRVRAGGTGLEVCRTTLATAAFPNIWGVEEKAARGSNPGSVHCG